MNGCSLKSKEELHMERGLSLLNNVKRISFSLTDSIDIRKIGFVDKGDYKVIIINVECFSPEFKLLNSRSIKLHLTLESGNNKQEYSIIPNVYKFDSGCYIAGRIKFNRNKIDKMKLYLLNDKSLIMSNILELSNIYTDND